MAIGEWLVASGEWPVWTSESMDELDSSEPEQTPKANWPSSYSSRGC